jgi:hypothetical protein
MKPIELMVAPNGDVRSVYDDARLEVFEAMKGKMSVQRASNVEWETLEDTSGWSVRAAHDPELAIRCILGDGMYKRVASKTGDILLFTTREAALEAEQDHFWELLPGTETP